MKISGQVPTASTLRETQSLKAISAQESSSEKISYTDKNGKSFNLTIGRSTKVDYATYDRQASSSGGGGLRLGKLDSLLSDDPAFKELVDKFKEIIEQFSAFHAKDGGGQGQISEHVEALSVDTSFTVEMDNVDTEYWSVENTASRLVDFATSMYSPGADKGEHAKKMIAAMEQGYGEAKESFGGWLPDISRQTIDLATKQLNDWAGEGQEEKQPAAGIDVTA